jgi:hypothetical protein
MRRRASVFTGRTYTYEPPTFDQITFTAINSRNREMQFGLKYKF